MSTPDKIPEPAFQWGTFAFFLATTSVALVGAPLYLWCFGISAFELLLLLFYIAASGMSITMGYHRLFAHVTYRAQPLVRFLFLFFGAAAFEQSALEWASQHRIHHLYTDTDRDPYSVKKGFWHAHIGWMIFWKQPADYDNVKDLQKDSMVRHQNRYYGFWAFVSGFLVPVLIGAAAGYGWGAFFLAVCFRIVFVHHGTFCINSFCHWVGQATYNPRASAKDHWLIAFFTFGEGYHSFHHRFPGDYRNGIRWYHWDPSKWLIFLMGCFGAAGSLRRVPHLRILQARLRAQKDQVHSRLFEKIESHPRFHAMKQAVELKYDQLQKTLREFEYAVTRYRCLRQQKAFSVPADFAKMISAAFEYKRQKQNEFRAAFQQWSLLIQRTSLILKAACA